MIVKLKFIYEIKPARQSPRLVRLRPHSPALSVPELCGQLAAGLGTAALVLQPLAAVAIAGPMLTQFRAGPMAGVDDIIFAARRVNETDGHWYANLGYYAHDPNRKAWREGAKLYRWNCVENKLIVLLDDPRGGIRDPQVSYDASKILFSYRKGGTENYLLYEMNSDGSGLRQLTAGEARLSLPAVAR